MQYTSVVDLDPDFSVFREMRFIKTRKIKFPAGERHIVIKCSAEISHGLSEAAGGDVAYDHSECLAGEKVLVSHRVKTMDDFMEMALTVETLKRLGAVVGLYLPYMPYGRQDRITTDGGPEAESFSLKVFARFVNSLGAAQVLSFDPHSYVTAALIENFQAIKPRKFVATAFSQIAQECPDCELAVVSPDDGQNKKVRELKLGLPIVYGDKVRDSRTGKLCGFQVLNPEAVKGRVCVIADDILDAGGTFIGLNERLMEAGAKATYLVCSHGVYSRGVDHLRSFARIFTTNSYGSQPQDPLTVCIPLHTL